MRPPTGLAVEHVTKRYLTPAGPVEVLKGVSFTLEPGDSIAIVGPSGSGKSTLLHIIGGLDRPSSGEVFFDGRCVSALPDNALPAFRSSVVGFVFQDHHLLAQCTALENVLVPTLAAAAGAAARTSDAERLLKRVGLASRMDALPADLSGGERQRVAVARALINRPRLLLADEPTGNLDTAAADEVASLLLDLAKETGMALVVVTHSTEIARRMRRAARLRSGVLQEVSGAL